MQIHSRLSLSANPDAFMLLDTWVDGQRVDVGLVRRWSTGGRDTGGQDAPGDAELQQQAARLLRARLERRPPCRRLQRLVLGDVADPHDIESALQEALGHCGADDALLVICTRREAHARALRTLNLRVGSFLPGLDPLELPDPGRWPVRRTARMVTAAAEGARPAAGRRRTDGPRPIAG